VQTLQEMHLINWVWRGHWVQIQRTKGMEFGVAQDLQASELIPKAKDHMVKKCFWICKDYQVIGRHRVWSGHISYWENWEN